MPSTKFIITTAVIAVAAYIVVAYVQRNVGAIPLVANYAPR